MNGTDMVERSMDHVGVEAEADETDEIIDDWHLPLEFHLFAQHELHKVYLNNRCQCRRRRRDSIIMNTHCSTTTDSDSDASSASFFFWLECVERLTPLDMMGLSSGAHDATGHCVWLGAFFLLAMLNVHDHPVIDAFSTTHSTSTASSSSSTTLTNNSTTLTTTTTTPLSPPPLPATLLFLSPSSACFCPILLLKLQSIFHSKRVVELGCGTGMAGIGLCLAHEGAYRPSHICFTDADPDVLALCRRNCLRNLSSSSPSSNHNNITLTRNNNKHNKNKEKEDEEEEDEEEWKPMTTTTTSTCLWSIAELTWGQDHAVAADTVLATDVIYDIGIVPSLVSTARNCLLLKRKRRRRSDSDSDNDNESSRSGVGHLCLSHVPRVCYTQQHPPPGMTARMMHDHDHFGCDFDLESYIQQQAAECGFELLHIIRPTRSDCDCNCDCDCCSSGTGTEVQPNHHIHIPDSAALNDHTTSMKNFQRMGAVIFVFVLRLARETIHESITVC